MRSWIPLLLVFAFLVPATLPASQPALPNADDPVLEARLNTLAADLRCVVCQNETLAESRASLALDLREEIREMMRAGLSDTAVVESLVDRYGDFVLYRPPLKPLTYALWGGPAAFLFIGFALAAAALYRRRAIPVTEDISPDALAQASRLLQHPDSIPSGSVTEPTSPSPPQDTR